MESRAENPQTAWSPERVGELVREGKFTYQSIELPYGLKTGGGDRSVTRDAIFPDDMTSKTILDIGTYNGYFCFEALKRGANAAVGIEVDSHRIQAARQLADCLGLNPEFRMADIEKDTIEGQFDYVLCLNVLHHLKNPIATLDRLIALTRERLILEVASVGSDRRRLKLSMFGAYVLKWFPVFYVKRTNLKRRGRYFFFTPRAIENLLLAHRTVFASVQILPSEHKGRFIAVAHKRRIKKLLVVSGPTSAGKSTFIKKLLSGDLPEAEQKLGLAELPAWKVTSAGQLRSLTEAGVEKLIFHYDVTHVHFNRAGIYGRHEPLEILGCAEEVICLILWTPPGILLDRFEQKAILPRTKRGRFIGHKREKLIYQAYKDPEQVYRIYRNWLDFCRELPYPHHIVSLSDGLRFYSPAEWEAAAAAQGALPRADSKPARG